MKQGNSGASKTPNSAFVQNYQSWATLPRGLNLIRNHVINPLLVATEKVVEQYMHTTFDTGAKQ